LVASDIDIHQKKYSIVKKNIGYRAWFYFRMGWSTYFAFILAAINTLTVTYFLAIENYPELMAVFPSFEIYIVIITSVGIPTLIFVGYSHYKKTNVFKSEVDILVESNPILRRTTVNADMNLRFSIKLFDLLLKLSKNKVSEDELNDAKKIQNEIINLIKNRSLSNEFDMNYMNEKMRKKSDYVLPKNPGLV
tara:strand:+ start:21 stop:596 length:576 start_codon:yes stop_codon:yes gene_type:complete